MQIKLLKTTKYKGKIIRPGIHDVTQKKAKELIDLKIAVIVDETKKEAKKSSKKDESLTAGELEKLQQEAELFEIEIDGKSYEDLLEEVELARDLGLDE